MKIMKLMSAAVIIAGTTLAFGALPAQAAPRHPRSINARQRRQHRRIHQGVRSGQLTRRETNRLNRREKSIARAERRDRRSGGKFTAAERRNIQGRLNRNSGAIYRQKHDRQHR